MKARELAPAYNNIQLQAINYCIVYNRYQFDPSKLGEYHEMNQRRGNSSTAQHTIYYIVILQLGTQCVVASHPLL